MNFLLRTVLPLAILLAVAGCNSTGSTLAMTSPATGTAMTVSQPQGTGAASSVKPDAQQLAAIAPKTHIEFAPIIGAAPHAVTPLSQRLAVDAKADGIAIVAANGAGATHILKGYFSAFSEGPKTTVVYVWDVLDPSGTRLHRIEGQEVTTGGTGSGWAAVPQAVMQKIADDTMAQFTAWLVKAKA